MGQLLTDVLTLEKEGLVGFTEIGEQVPIQNNPKIDFFSITNRKNADWKTMDNLIKERLCGIYSDTYCIKCGSTTAIKDLFIMPYNLYKRRS